MNGQRLVDMNGNKIIKSGLCPRGDRSRGLRRGGLYALDGFDKFRLLCRTERSPDSHRLVALLGFRPLARLGTPAPTHHSLRTLTLSEEQELFPAA